MFSTHRMDEAAFADEHLHLEEGKLTKSNESKGNSENALLKEFNLLPSAKILSSLHKAGSLFTAPAKIQSSIISRMPAMAKYIAFLAVFIFALVQNSFPLCIAAFALSTIYALCAKYSMRTVIKTFFILLPWLILFTAFECLLYKPLPEDTIILNLPHFFVTVQNLEHLLVMSCRCLAAFTSMAVFMQTTDERQILDGLNFLHCRYIVLIVAMVFRFVPLLLEEATGIIKTQLVRGSLGKAKGPLAKIRLILPLILPLMIQTLKKADNLADALDARYFGTNKSKQKGK